MLDLDKLDPKKTYTVYYASETPHDLFDSCPLNTEFELRASSPGSSIPWNIHRKGETGGFRCAHGFSRSLLSLYPVGILELTTTLELNAAAELDGNPKAELLSQDMYCVPKILKEGL